MNIDSSRSSNVHFRPRYFNAPRDSNSIGQLLTAGPPLFEGKVEMGELFEVNADVDAFDGYTKFNIFTKD